MLTRKK